MPEAPGMPAKTAGRNLDPLLKPRSIAIIGASPDPRRVRGMAMASLLRSGFSGPIYPINPSHGEVQGYPAYRSLGDAPGPVDLAILVVGDEQIMPALRDCAANGAGAAIVMAGLPGGEAGRAIDRAVADFARETGIPVLGPNCLGFWNMGINVAATFAPLAEDAQSAADAPSRTISIVTQSGGIGQSLYDKACRAALGVRYVITTGNEADLEMLELVDWLVAEGGSRIIILYLEGFRHPQNFAEVAARAKAQGVRILVIKAGRSDAGARAAVSHTAHMTGAMAAYDAVFARHAVRRVDDLDEAIGLAKILSGGRPMAGRRVLVLSTGGGFGALLADACEARNLQVTDLDDGLRAKLDERIPVYGHAGNPVDLPGGNVLEDNGASLSQIIGVIEDSGAYDAIILCFGLDASGRVERMRPSIEPVLRCLTRPVLFHSPTQVDPGNWRALAELGVQQYSVAEAAFALDALAWFHEADQRTPQHLPPPLDTLPALEKGWDFATEKLALRAAGIPLAAAELADNEEAAVSAARSIGYPVALKTAARGVAHKSDIGGVELSINNDDMVRAAYARIAAVVAAAGVTDGASTVVVQKMAAPGREFALGVIRDPDFGLLLMLSAGGVLIEVLRDVAYAPVPVDSAGATAMVSQLRSSVLLEPLRGQPVGDRAALERLIVDISQLAMAMGERLAELEFNPVIVHSAGTGVTVVDTLIVPKPE